MPASPHPLQVLYVHGMGRTSLSGWPVLHRLARAGLSTATLDYFVSMQSFDAIVGRLQRRILRLAARGDYALVGHSLGGVLLRAALPRLPAGTRGPRRLFLLGSPVRPTTLARRLQRTPAYRLLTGDCGQLLADTVRMSAVPAAAVPATAILGTHGWPPGRGPFDGPNDGVVTVAEASADWLTDRLELPLTHTWLPASGRVADIILERLGLS